MALTFGHVAAARGAQFGLAALELVSINHGGRSAGRMSLHLSREICASLAPAQRVLSLLFLLFLLFLCQYVQSWASGSCVQPVRAPFARSEREWLALAARAQLWPARRANV